MLRESLFSPVSLWLSKVGLKKAYTLNTKYIRYLSQLHTHEHAGKVINVGKDNGERFVPFCLRLKENALGLDPKGRVEVRRNGNGLKAKAILSPSNNFF